MRYHSKGEAFIHDLRNAEHDCRQTKRQPSTATQSVDARKTSTPVPGLKSEATSNLTSVPQSTSERPGTDYPAHHTSTIDPNGNPVHPTTGKPILSTDFDADFPSESSKPWRKPGSDITDYFNYGFDEFTWASYCLKQQQMPKEIAEIKNQAESLKAFVEGIPGGGMPPIPGLPVAPTGPGGAANGTMPAMPGMPSEAEMQQMFAGMMAQGIDPSTMDPSQFMQMMMGGAGGGQTFGGQSQGFGAGQGPGQQPQAGFGGGGGGFDQGGNFGGGGGRGRGRGGRRNW